MKKNLSLGMVMLMSCTFVFSQIPDTSKINSEAKQFMSDFTASMLNATTTQNVYADAFIGKLFPAAPPHFAVGLNSSIAELKLDNLDNVNDELNLGLNIDKNVVLPFFTFDAKIGGIFFPFDLGLSISKTPVMDFYGVKLDYFTVGTDLRWAIIEENIVKPNLSVGIAYYYSSANISGKNSIGSINYESEMQVLSLSAQISKKFVFITPFIGARFAMSSTDNAFDWSVNAFKGDTTYSKTFASLQSATIYGGLGFDIFIIKLTPSISYDPMNEILSGAISLRVQL